jgi:hypothetical protein
MDRVVRDILHWIGVEQPHPEDVRRVTERYLSGVTGMRAMAFKLLWPWLYGRLLAAREERMRADALRVMGQKEAPDADSGRRVST